MVFSLIEEFLPSLLPESQTESKWTQREMCIQAVEIAFTFVLFPVLLAMFAEL